MELAEDDAINLAAFVWDAIAGTDFNHVDTQFVSRMIDEYKNKRTSDALDWMQSDPRKAAAKYASDKGFARGIAAAGEDYVFTDIFGKTRYVGGRDTQEKLTALQEKERAEIARVTGNAAVVPNGYEITDGGNDRNSTMTYYVGEGANRRLFKYATDGKGKSPVLMEQLGGEWVRKDAPATEKQALQERDKRMKADVAAIIQSDELPTDFDAVRDRFGFAYKNFSQKDWEKTDAILRTNIAEAIVKERYLGDGSSEYRTDKEKTAAAATTTAKDARTAVKQAKKAARDSYRFFDQMDEYQYSDALDALRLQGYDEAAINWITSDNPPAGAGMTVEKWRHTDVNERVRLYNKKRAAGGAEPAAQKTASRRTGVQE